MTLDEFRHEMEAFRDDVVKEANVPWSTIDPAERMNALYQKFDADERAMADQVLIEWVKSDYDAAAWSIAQRLIDEFKIKAAVPALEQLAQRHAWSYGAITKFELRETFEVIARLTDPAAPGSAPWRARLLFRAKLRIINYWVNFF